MITYPDSVRYLYSLGNEVKTIKLGLERITALLDALGRPDRTCRLIHVAGTNGKGSVCAMIESGLRAAGHRTGLYTSPHLVEPVERIQVAGVPVTPEQFAGAFDAVHRAAQDLLDSGSIDGPPTYFETVTAMGFLLFREMGVETAVIETGLGGRLDATNAITPILCVITPIDYDHESWLGSSLRMIAGEKAGILKPGVPAVFARQRPEALERLNETAAACGIAVEHTSAWNVQGLEVHARGSCFSASRPGSGTFRIECNLAGGHQVDNAVTALAGLAQLGLDEVSIRAGIRTAKWPGRLEVVAQDPEIILDGAHNPAGVRALAAYIREFYSRRRVWLIYGTMRDKSVAEIGDTLAPLAAEILLTAVDSPRALRPEALRGVFGDTPVRMAPRLADAIEIVRREADPADAVFITGSLFLVGEARSLLVP
jgi:dihydrofolate synthase/folylpolyglutamate synthase